MYSEIELKLRMERYASRSSPPADGRLNLLAAAARGAPLEGRWGENFLAFCQALIEAEQAPHRNIRGLSGHHLRCGGVRSY